MVLMKLLSAKRCAHASTAVLSCAPLPAMHPLTTPPNDNQRPIGVFDSGLGGLSILRALRAELPHENFIYLADSGHAPYGERDDAFLLQRAVAITAHLRTAAQIKALVVACNTATAAAIHRLRALHPGLPIVGIEPALKPAVAHSQTKRIGIMATRSTLGSEKFRSLLKSLAEQADFVLQACDGLADAIERADSLRIQTLCQRYTQALGHFGTQPGEIDSLVLGCTHYPLVQEAIRPCIGPAVTIVDNGAAVARQTQRLLGHLARHTPPIGQCQLVSTGTGPNLQQAAQHWLGLNSPLSHVWV
jgi:glutamate racemase